MLNLFLGSGSVFINLEKEFDKYIINDIEPAIIKIFNTIKTSSYCDFVSFSNNVLAKFGNFKASKSDKETAKTSYYAFRNKFNEKLWNSESEEEGFGLILLYNSCLNSLGRWGPNGFNQSWGDRLYLPDEIIWNNVQKRLAKTEIYNLDFFKLLEHVDINNSLMFLDPPYFKSPSFSYKGISSNYYENFIKFCRMTKADILYTDVNHDDLIMFKITLRENMRNVSPNRKSELKEKEIMFINY